MPSAFFGLSGLGGQYARAIQRLFALPRGPGIVSPEFQSSIDLFGRPELWALHGGSLLMGILDGLAAGGAGFRTQVSISNPANSKEIAIIEAIMLMHTATEALYHAISQTQLTAPTGNIVSRDTRRITTTGGSMPSQIQLRTQNNAALANIASIVGKTQTPANATVIIPLDYVLGPGWNYRLYPAADNVAIASQITFFIRSRPALDEELQGL